MYLLIIKLNSWQGQCQVSRMWDVYRDGSQMFYFACYTGLVWDSSPLRRVFIWFKIKFKRSRNLCCMQCTGVCQYLSNLGLHIKLHLLMYLLIVIIEFSSVIFIVILDQLYCISIFILCIYFCWFNLFLDKTFFLSFYEQL